VSPLTCVSLPLFDVSQVDFMLVTVSSVTVFTYFLSVLFVEFYTKYIEENRTKLK